MRISKQHVVRFLESRFGPQQAARAAEQLPDEVDHEEHADALSRLGVDVEELLGEAGGAEETGERAAGGREATGQAGGGAGGITAGLGSSAGTSAELGSSSHQPGGSAAGGHGGQLPGGP